MTLSELLATRLCAHNLVKKDFSRPVDVVRHMGAMQAQDYLSCLWAIAARLKQTHSQADIEAAFTHGDIVRSWPLRGTLHVVAGADLRWMLELSRPRVTALHANRLKREHGLDGKEITRCEKIIGKLFSQQNIIGREELYQGLERNKINVDGQRGLQILWRLAIEGLICFGPRQGKQQTFVMIDEWLPKSVTLDRDEALGMLANRFFKSHGPATLNDLAWWGGLTLTDASRAIDVLGASVTTETYKSVQYFCIDRGEKQRKSVSLLPSFDEYFIAYEDRSDLLGDVKFSSVVSTSNGIFRPIVLVNGKVIGTWKRTIKSNHVEIVHSIFGKLDEREETSLIRQSNIYSKFLGLEPQITKQKASR